MTDIIKIILVDDHPIFLKGLRLMINECSQFKVIGEATNGQEFLELLTNLTPDLVLIDIKMPVMNGVDATKEAIEKYPDLKIMALTMFSDLKYLRLMAEAGASGFILKSIGKAELEFAINTLKIGKTYFSPQLLAEFAEFDPAQSSGIFLEDLNERLTERELDVLQYIVNGLSTQEIADKLFISKRTVEGHRANLIAKTATRNVVDLVIYAIRNKLAIV
ncbi:response regulator transcription factor [Kaistella sp. G5-32]|uniref:Response regulator transcription factor n=1 Tax=Kaistella gelatinilytica TaxID=2787636 RepID=A0ABS0F896_9FLAO|nr:response regulator transcription factor [Kaistella gelatinilytica]MBF8455934.1 response regulator transcription factor [Kaistella gelatinilytica]